MRSLVDVASCCRDLIQTPQGSVCNNVSITSEKFTLLKYCYSPQEHILYTHFCVFDFKLIDRVSFSHFFRITYFLVISI